MLKVPSAAEQPSKIGLAIIGQRYGLQIASASTGELLSQPSRDIPPPLRHFAIMVAVYRFQHSACPLGALEFIL